MSRFLPDVLHIGIEPERVALVRRSRGWHNKIVADTMLMLDINTPDGMLTLGQELTKERWRASQAQMVLADGLLRYFIVDRPAGARNPKEVELATALRFEDLFGEPANDWDLRVDLQPFTSNYLACASRKHLLLDLHQQCQQAGIVVHGVTPFAIAEWNRYRKLASKQAAWFVACGGESLWIARRDKGRWLSVRQQHCVGALTEQLPQVLARESLRLGWVEPSPVALLLTGRIRGQEAALSECFPAAGKPSAPLWPGQSASWADTHRVALANAWPTCA